MEELRKKIEELQEIIKEDFKEGYSCKEYEQYAEGSNFAYNHVLEIISSMSSSSDESGSGDKPESCEHAFEITKFKNFSKFNGTLYLECRHCDAWEERDICSYS